MSDEVIELENIVNLDGMRQLHLMSNGEIDSSHLLKYAIPADVKVEHSKEVGVYHARASWPMCGQLVINCEGWPVPKIFVAWSYLKATSLTLAMYEAANHYEDLFGQRPQYAYVSKLPRGVEDGKPVGDLLLFEAEWMVRKCVAVGWLYQ